MTSKIKVDNINKVSDDSNIINKCGTTITLGASGDSIALASGASQTGFGRTGTVDWNTTKKTGDFTATNGDGFFVDTSSGAVEATLPGSPSAGNIVAFSDYNGNFETNNLTLARNGSNINGNAVDFIVSKNNVSLQLIYVDATEGWRVVLTGSLTGEGIIPGYIEATGGSVTNSGSDRIHTFTGPGTFTVSKVACEAANNLVSYMVVAGGGGGGSKNNAGGGGGAGGFRETKSPATPYTASPLDGYSTPGNRITVTATGYPITVGGAGSGSCGNCATNNTAGGPSTFSTITSAGGATGGNQPAPGNGGSGGSGGGAGRQLNPGVGGCGNVPPVTPPQGNGGGPKSYPVGSGDSSGGGGGATVAGASNGPTGGGPGGAGATTSINGTPTAFAGGGGGGGYGPGCLTVAPGGTGGGGNGGLAIAAVNGTDNTGGGGGGAGYPNGGPGKAGNGGSGVVIIRYKVL